MSEAQLSLGEKILKTWQSLSSKPGGKFIFNRLIARIIPYSGSIGAQVLSLEPGHARLKLKDKRAVRNHLNSIHAIALTNLGELTSGLALNAGLSSNVRGIVVDIQTQYLKKARGTLYSQCKCEIPTVTEEQDFLVEAEIHDADNNQVARVIVKWRLAPVNTV